MNWDGTKTAGMLLLDHLASGKNEYEFAEKGTIDFLKNNVLPFLDEYPLIAITRPFESLEYTERYVIEKRLLPVSCPMIELEPNRTGSHLELLKRMKVEKQTGIIVIFTSRNGIKFLNNYLSETDSNLKELLKNCSIWTIGEKTAESLRRENLDVDFIPEKFSSQGLLNELKDTGKAAKKKIWVLRSDRGNPILIKGLRGLGAEVEEIQLYHIGKIKNPVFQEASRNLFKVVSEKRIAIFSFGSRMTVKNFFGESRKMGIKDETIQTLNETMTLAIGPPTKDALHEEGIKEVVMPENYTFQHMIDMAADYSKEAHFGR